VTRILFVCMGNICRSPTAEGVMRALLDAAGADGAVELDSAGIGAWHVGEAPDRRSAAAAARRGIALEGSARQVRPRDFEDFDLILAMDGENLRALRALAPDAAAAAKLRLLRDYDPAAPAGDRDVPDPYYGEGDGFETVLDQVDAACRGLLATLYGTSKTT